MDDYARKSEAQLYYGPQVWRRDPTDDEVSLESEEDIPFALKIFDDQYHPRHCLQQGNPGYHHEIGGKLKYKNVTEGALAAHQLALDRLRKSLTEKNAKRKARRGTRFRWLTKTYKSILGLLENTAYRATRIRANHHHLAALCTQYAWPTEPGGTLWLGYTIPRGAWEPGEDLEEVDLS